MAIRKEVLRQKPEETKLGFSLRSLKDKINEIINKIASISILNILDVPWYDASKYATDSLRRKNGLAGAINKIGSKNKTILITNQQDIPASITVPANITLKFLQGGFLNIDSGKTVTINGHVEAGLFQVFEEDGVVVYGAGSTLKVPVEWRGVTPDGVDSTANMKLLLIDIKASTVKTMKFGCGNYAFNDQLDLYSGMILEGENKYITTRRGALSPGKEQTRITFAPTSEKTLFHTNKEGAEPYAGKISISNLYINGNTTGGVTYSKYAIHAEDLAQCTFENLGIEHFQIGVYNDFTMTNVWTNVTIQYCTVCCIEYNTDTNTTDMWNQGVFRQSPWAVIDKHSVNIRYIACLFESLSVGGVELYKETNGAEFISCYAENVPSSGGTPDSMFKVGYSGTTPSVSVTISIIGGMYAGPEGDGRFLDCDDIYSAKVVSAHASRYAIGVRATANTENHAIGLFGVSWQTVPTILSGTTDKIYGVLKTAGLSTASTPIAYSRYVKAERGYFKFRESLYLGTGEVKVMSEVNSPEGVWSAPIGSLFLRTNGGANTTLYIKESGTGNTGWVAK